jgi:hypothetical protein
MPALVPVTKITHPTIGDVIFYAEEIDDLRVNPFQRIEEQISQSGNITLVHVGGCYFIFTYTMRMAWRETLEKLDGMRNAQAVGGGNDEFRLYPFWLYDQLTNYTVLWTNVADFFEYHRHGRIAADWTQQVVLKEVITGSCTVPS